MDNLDLQIDDTDFDPFFTREEMMGQHCHLLEAEAAELRLELQEARRKIATLVVMWSATTKELAEVKKELQDTSWKLSEAFLEPSSTLPSGSGEARHHSESKGAEQGQGC